MLVFFYKDSVFLIFKVHCTPASVAAELSNATFAAHRPVQDYGMALLPIIPALFVLFLLFAEVDCGLRCR